jgi:hypothetical protein
LKTSNASAVVSKMFNENQPIKTLGAGMFAVSMKYMKQAESKIKQVISPIQPQQAEEEEEEETIEFDSGETTTRNINEMLEEEEEEEEEEDEELLF